MKRIFLIIAACVVVAACKPGSSYDPLEDLDIYIIPAEDRF